MREIFFRTIDNELVEIECNCDITQDRECIYLYSLFVKISKDDSFEYEEFLDIKETLIVTLQDALFAGSRYIDGWSELYFYVKEAKNIDKRVLAFFKDSSYKYESSITKDAKWDFCFKYLTPNELESLFIESQKIIDELILEGDDIDKPREVEHYALFDTKSQMDRFIKNAQEIGYLFKDELDVESYGVALSKFQNLKEIDISIKELLELAKKEHGSYELWSSILVK